MAKEIETLETPAVIDLAEIKDTGEKPPVIPGDELAGIVQENRDSLIQSSEDKLKKVSSDLEGSVEKQQNTEDMLLANMMAAGQESAFRDELAKNTGLGELQQALSNTNTAIVQNARRGSAAVSQTIKDALGTGLTKGSLRTRLSNTQLENSIQSNLLAADSAALKNNVDAQVALIDSAVKAKFEPIKTEMQIQKFQLNRFDDAVKRGDIKLTAAEKKNFDLKMGKIEKEEQDLEEATELSQTILKNKAPQPIKDALLKAETKAEILSIPGVEKYLMSPAEKLELAIKKATLTKLREGSETTITKEQKQAQKEKAKSGMDLINRIKGNQVGFVRETGSTMFGRGVFEGIVPAFSVGKGQKFKAEIGQLLGGTFVKGIIDAKASGATFGSLDKNEGQKLGNSITALNEMVDVGKDGKVKNIKASEEAVMEQLDILQRGMELDYVRSGGELTPDMAIADDYINDYMNSVETLLVDTNDVYSNSGY